MILYASLVQSRTSHNRNEFCFQHKADKAAQWSSQGDVMLHLFFTLKTNKHAPDVQQREYSSQTWQQARKVVNHLFGIGNWRSEKRELYFWFVKARINRLLLVKHKRQGLKCQVTDISSEDVHRQSGCHRWLSKKGGKRQECKKYKN